jgi:uroporphyrin-III C-methyltransferase/precorrin-2 dehydrogenase/sirohydrochlorin ferrochelatase
MGELNTFPLSYKVRGRRVVVVGGGAEALAKARLAVRTSAEVAIVAPAVEADFSALSVTLHERAFVPADLEGAALCFVADHGPDGEAAIAEARRRHVPLNVVDVPDACDFYTPSIVDRAPLTVAISTEGDEPVLARLVRARIEALLAPETGAIARIAGAMRERVARALHGAAARRYYEALVTAPGLPTEAEAVALLAAHAAGGSAGEVWLIGAGPGAEDLLTLRAQRLLQEADVVVHDQLVPQAVVEMGRRDAERIAGGKRAGHHSFTQAQINALLVRLARQGRRVARLKSGDPMVFGRAGEELEALRKAGVAHTIVPGVSAALAAAADAAVPVTLRKVSSGVVFATAHGADDAELAHWAALAGSGLTLALYMGKEIAAATAARLIGQGMGRSMPAGIVVNAGRANRSLYLGTVGELAAGTAAFPAGPAIIFVGEAVAAGEWSGAIALAERELRVA